jgi:membrane-associated phospholipid phosphatase
VDLALLRLLRTRGHWPPLERAVSLYARAGEHGALWLAMAALVRDRRTIRVVVVTLIANTAMKEVVRRARPVLEQELPPLVPTLTGRSYPSAHASTSFAGALVLRHALPPRVVYSVAVTMALSRVYLGVHYPSDIAAGALLGTLVGSVGRVQP